MKEFRISAETSVANVLSSAPGAERIFLGHRTACVGCSLGRFCSLRDVALTYELDLEHLIGELQGAARLAIPLTERSNS